MLSLIKIASNGYKSSGYNVLVKNQNNLKLINK